ncbi:hypothetical protein LPB140_09795 [Sphingorhabdus lutea]|uniref:DUF6265 domain-containing protein n=1 Tax=Sphingorhabdus lutea TaxID=1913578 RepID=A0A1L3JF47_9SPHN|nr:hypothetical protein LPB140_09795 [Sphingorhabdus lutea]
MPHWLSGAWESTNKGPHGDLWGDEYWTSPRGGIMMGAARMGQGEALILWENLRIAYDENGKVALWTMPRGAAATKFDMAMMNDYEILFENMAHDYPQRIKYWRDGDMLRAEISLIDGSRPYQFAYKKTTPK